MPLQICAFAMPKLANDRSGQLAQAISGPPRAVSAASFTGDYTVPAECSIIKIVGDGTIAWSGVAEPEKFAGVEFRGVYPGLIFTVA